MTERCLARARSLQARRPIGDVAPGIRELLSWQSEISGDPSSRISGASDGSRPNALAGAIACPAIANKLNDMRVIRRALRGLARMLLRYLQKKLSAKEATAQEQTTRGDVQMPASIQLIT